MNFRTWLGFFLGLLACNSALAAAVVESLSGNVVAGPLATQMAPLSHGQRIASGATVITGANGSVLLRFDDGQAMLLDQNTEFKITDYAFKEAEPAKDSFVFDLLRGALRSVTGVLTKRNSEAYKLRVPQATIGIRGTDFMVVLYNPMALSVISGITTVGNAAGVVSVAAGGLVSVATTTTLATATTMGALPAGVAGSFSSMGSVAITGGAAAGTGAGSGAGTTGAGSTGAGAGAGSASAGVGAGAAAGGAGVGLGGVAAGLAGVAAIAGAVSSSSTSTTHTTTAHH